MVFLSMLILFVDVAIEKWREGGDDYEGNQIRNISFKMPLSNLLVPKSSHFEELQVSKLL